MVQSTRTVFLPLTALNLVVVCCLVLTRLQPYEQYSDFCFALVSLCMLLPATQFTIIEPLGGGALSDFGGAILVYIEIAIFFAFAFAEGLRFSCRGSRKQQAVKTTPAQASNRQIQGPKQVPSVISEREVRATCKEHTRVLEIA